MSGRRSLSMDYEDPSDSSGTDDDLPPTHSGGRGSRGVRVSGNGRAASGVIYASSQPASSNVDHMIHRLEQEAYTAVLRAFGAQSESITWAKERLMTDLRKELRVSDEQHREFLTKVGGDETVRQIHSMSRQLASSAPVGSLPAAELSPPPALSQSRKKQKTAPVPQVPMLLPPPPSSTPTPPLPPHSKAAAVQSSSGTKRSAPGPRGGKKPKGGRVPAAPKGGGNKVGRPSSKVVENAAEMSIDPYVGRRVKTRWPEDNTFYEALISDYNAETGCHALVYDMDTENETWEWISLKEVPPGDLKWVEGPNAVVSGRKAPPQGSRGVGRGMKRGPKGSMASPGAKAKSVGRGSSARGWRGPASAENGARTVELIPLEDLAKEVDKLEEEDDLSKLESAKRAAKAHEESIRKALAEVGDSSDEEADSDDAGQPPSSHTQSIDHDREHRNGPSNSRDHTADSDEDETAGNERGEASDGEHTAGEGGGASEGDDDQQGDDGDDKDDDV